MLSLTWTIKKHFHAFLEQLIWHLPQNSCALINNRHKSNIAQVEANRENL